MRTQKEDKAKTPRGIEFSRDELEILMRELDIAIEDYQHNIIVCKPCDEMESRKRKVEVESLYLKIKEEWIKRVTR